MREVIGDNYKVLDVNSEKTSESYICKYIYINKKIGKRRLTKVRSRRSVKEVMNTGQ